MKLPIALASIVFAGLAQAQGLPSTDTRAVPTYESVGLYWSSPGASAAGGCEVRYRRAGDPAWKQGLSMWFDARNNECRGSLVHLTSNAEYEVQLNLPGVAPSRALTFRTWPDQRPVASTVMVPSGAATLAIRRGGAPRATWCTKALRGPPWTRSRPRPTT